MALPKPFRIPMFNRLARDWFGLPWVINEGITAGMVATEPRPGWVPLKGLSPISDAFPAKAYAKPGFAKRYNKAIRKFRRRETICAFLANISRAEIEARLETFSRLGEFFDRQEAAEANSRTAPPTL